MVVVKENASAGFLYINIYDLLPPHGDQSRPSISQPTAMGFKSQCLNLRDRQMLKTGDVVLSSLVQTQKGNTPFTTAEFRIIHDAIQMAMPSRIISRPIATENSSGIPCCTVKRALPGQKSKKKNVLGTLNGLKPNFLFWKEY